MLEKLRAATADGSLDSVLECLPGDDEEDESDDEDDPDGSNLHTLLKTVKDQIKSDTISTSSGRMQTTLKTHSH
jgi:hypothetical protein